MAFVVEHSIDQSNQPTRNHNSRKVYPLFIGFRLHFRIRSFELVSASIHRCIHTNNIGPSIECRQSMYPSKSMLCLCWYFMCAFFFCWPKICSKFKMNELFNSHFSITCYFKSDNITPTNARILFSLKLFVMRLSAEVKTAE